MADAPLPANAVKAIFGKLLLTYGSKLEAQYAGQDVELIRDHWAHELRWFTPRMIEWALAHLPPTFPPTVLEFKQIANTCPARPDAPQLGGPRANPERVRAALAKLQTTRATAPQDRREWARRILQRHADGSSPRPTLTAVEMARHALRHELSRDATETTPESAP